MARINVCILSDLHLGVANEWQNDFRFADATFAAFLAGLAREYAWVILAGDVFELWEGSGAHPPQSKALFEEICGSWPQIMKVIGGTPNIIPLTGNHDAAVTLHGWLPKARTEVLVPELSLFVAHGHQGDRAWCAETSWCSPLVTCLAGCVARPERLFDPDFDEKVARPLQRLANRGTSATIRSYAFAVAEKLGVGVVCLGHTHDAELTAKDGVVYANCGRCVGKGRNVQLVCVTSGKDDFGRSVDVLLLEVDPGDPKVVYPLASRELSAPPTPPEPPASLPPVLPPGSRASQRSQGGLVLRGNVAQPVPASFLA